MESDFILSAGNVNFCDKIHYPDIKIPSKKITFICGESGCGKSTLLHIFNRTIIPTAGMIKYKGQPVEQLDPVKLRQEVLLAGQSLFLFDQSIKNNFITYYSFREKPCPDELAMEEFLRICCAPFPLDSLCIHMSGGERQRIYLAIFLSFQPNVLMLDEPTSALDKETAYKLLNNIKEYAISKGMTLLIVCHDRGLASHFADQMILLGQNKESAYQ